MRSKLFTQVLGAALFLTLATAPVAAKPVKVVPGDPPVTIDVPSTWETSEVKRGVQLATAEEEVMIWFESYRPSQLDAIIKEHNEYYNEQGVKITGEAQAQSKEYPTYFIKVSEYPATYEGKPTVLRYLSVVPKAEDKRHILVSYWASPEGDKEYDGEVNKIMDSLRASVEAQ